MGCPNNLGSHAFVVVEGVVVVVGAMGGGVVECLGSEVADGGGGLMEEVVTMSQTK